MKKKGFTLLELLVVLVIVGVLCALIIPAIIKMCDNGEDGDSTSMRAVINLSKDESVTVEVDYWYHYKDKQLQIVTTDGTVYYVSEDDVVIIKEKQ